MSRVPLGSALGPVHPASPWKVWATGQGTALVPSQTAWNGGVPVGLAPRVGGWENAVCSGVDSRGLCEVRNALGPQWDPSRRDPAAVAPSAVGVNVEGGGLRSLAWRGCQPPGMQGTPWHNPIQILVIPSGECRLCELFPNTITALQCTATHRAHTCVLTLNTDPLHRVWTSPGGSWQHIGAPLQLCARGQPMAQCLVRDPSLLCCFPLLVLPLFSEAFPCSGAVGSHRLCALSAPCPTSPAHIPRPGSAGTASSANTAIVPLFEGFSIVTVYFTALFLPAHDALLPALWVQKSRHSLDETRRSPSRAELHWVGADALGISLPQMLGATVASGLSTFCYHSDEVRVGPEPGAVGQSETQHCSAGGPGGAVPLAPACSSLFPDAFPAQMSAKQRRSQTLLGADCPPHTSCPTPNASAQGSV